MNKKKILIIGSIVAILLSVAVIIYATTKQNDEPADSYIEGITLPENKDILKDTVVNSVNITNVSIITRDGISTYKATVSNETDESIKIGKLYVVFYQGDEQSKVIALSDITLASQNKTYISITSENDLTKVTKIQYVVE